MDDERARLKAAGFSDAEIDAELGPARPTVRAAAAESTTMQGPGKAPARAMQDLATVKGVARSAADGALLGFGDNAESLLFRTPLDKIRSEQAQFRQDHPVMAPVAEIAGGLLTAGGAASALKSAPRLASLLTNPTAGVGRRLLTAAAGGAAVGGVEGAGKADGKDVFPGFVKGAAIGAGTAGLLGTAAEGVKAVRNLVGSGVRGATPGPVRSLLGRTIEAESPDLAGARRVLNRLPNGKSVDDVAKAARSADPALALSEVVDDLDPRKALRGTSGLRVARNTGRERDMLDASLTDRAAEEPARWYRTVSRETGVASPRDPVAVMQEAKAEARKLASPIYDQATDGVTVTDALVPDLLERPAGATAYDATVQGYANRGKKLPTRGEILRGAKTAPAGPDVDVPGVRASKAPGESDLMNMSLAEMRAARRGGTSLGKLSDDELALEHMYTQQMDGKDAGIAALRDSPDYAEYLALKSQGLDEDARGVMERMGYFDPIEFNAVARDGAGAARRMGGRSDSLKAIEAELERRRATVGDMPDDVIPSVGPQRIPSRAGVSVPEPGDAATLPTMEARAMQRWKFELDDDIERLMGKEGSANSQKLQELIGVRDQVEGLLYKYANPSETGENLWGKAQGTFAKPIRRGESFVAGNKVEQAGTKEAVERLQREAADPEAFRQGAASKLLERASGVSDGEAGQIRNPIQGPLGSETRRARTRAAFPNEESYGRATEDAKAITRRLDTRRRVSGNSTTAANLSEMADEFSVNPMAMVKTVVNPAQGLTTLLGDQGKRLMQGLSADQATVMGRLLGAGLPDQMPRDQALSLLRAAIPKLEQAQRRSLLTRSAAGAAAGGASVRQ